MNATYAPERSVDTASEPPSLRTNETGIGPGTATPSTRACPETLVAFVSGKLRVVGAETAAVERRAYSSGPIVALAVTGHVPGLRQTSNPAAVAFPARRSGRSNP